MSDFEIRDNVLGNYIGNDTVFTVPDGVVKIYGYAFVNRDRLKEIILPEGLKKISWYAFKGCENLEEIALPKGLEEIGWRAFYDCKSLKEIELPDSLIFIGDSIFEGCSNLQKIVMSKKAFEVIEKKALEMKLRTPFWYLGINENKTKITIKEG